jgi:dinuclear metal center YbgI/SA1388 family protein
MITVKSITSFLESLAPGDLQEAYDNSGLITGSPDMELSGAIISLDCTEEVVREAMAKKANLVISHHPILFSGIKSLTGKNYIERTLILAIKNDIAIYALHTNLDNVKTGVNKQLADQIGLINTQILRPLHNLCKLVTFIPTEATDQVLQAIHLTGAGNIGHYSECSFKVNGKGYFKPDAGANPAIGRKGKKEEVIEDRVEIIFPQHLTSRVLVAMKEAHPYEEVAHYLTKLENSNQEFGAGMIGDLQEVIPAEKFLKHLKSTLSLSCIRHTAYNRDIHRVAICGGSGSFLLADAIRNKADAYVTGDVKYHNFFDADSNLMYCDIGHYESEIGTNKLLFDMLTKKFTNFAFHLSECVTNPIKYYK